MLQGTAHTVNGARSTYGLPAIMPARVNNGLNRTAGAKELAADLITATDLAEGRRASVGRPVATRHSLELLHPAGGGVLEQEMTNRVPADARVDYVAPVPQDPDVLKWQVEESVEPILIRLSYVNRSAEQSGQSRIFLTGVGLGGALSLLLMGFELGPWRSLARLWRHHYRAARKEIG